MKKIKLTWNNVLLCLGFIFAVVPIICLAGAGYQISLFEDGEFVRYSDNLAGFFFGYHTLKLYATSGSESLSMTQHFKGGVSVLGLLSLILLILGIAGMIAATALKKPIIRLFISPVILLSGIFMFCLLIAGSDIEGIPFDEQYVVYEPYKGGLGVGAILYGVFAILSSGCFVANNLIRKELPISKK